MDYEAFFGSLNGQLLCAAAVVVIFAVIFWLSRAQKQSSFAVALSGMLIALAFVANNILPRWHLPQGGSVTLCSMLFLFLISYTYGERIGVCACIAYGVLDLLFSPSAYYPMQILLDYPLAFGMLGIGGVLRNKSGGLYFGYLLSVFGRYVVSTLSGLIFFAEYTPAGWNPLLWAIYYNACYLGIEAALTLLILSIPTVHNTIYRLVDNARKSNRRAA